MISIKIHKSYRDVIAVCDKEILGEIFQEGEYKLELKENFFDGDYFEEEKAIEKLKKLKLDDPTFNIVGEKATQAAIKAGLIDEEDIRTIANIPYSMVLL